MPIVLKQETLTTYCNYIHQQTTRTCTVLHYVHQQTTHTCTVLHYVHQQTTHTCTSLCTPTVVLGDIAFALFDISLARISRYN